MKSISLRSFKSVIMRFKSSLLNIPPNCWNKLEFSTFPLELWICSPRPTGQNLISWNPSCLSFWNEWNLWIRFPAVSGNVINRFRKFITSFQLLGVGMRLWRVQMFNVTGYVFLSENYEMQITWWNLAVHAKKTICNLSKAMKSGRKESWMWMFW